jgi:hypothetical protein
MTIESKNCKACRPKHKPRTKLNAKEIHNRVQTGDMNNFIADKLREKRQRNAHNAQAKAARNRWVKEWKAELKKALAPITKEIIHARKAWEYARDKGYVAKAEFYFEYHGMLKHEKNHAEMDFLLRPRRPPSARWADYIGDAVFTRVREMWAVMPPIHKYTSRIPLLIKHRPDGE